MKRDMEPVAVVKKAPNIVEVGTKLKAAKVNREAAELTRELIQSTPRSEFRLWLTQVIDNRLVELNTEINHLTKTILTVEL